MLDHLPNMMIFHSLMAFLTSFLALICLMPYFIRALKRLSIRQIIRDDGPERHLAKAKTPTAGGFLIMMVIILTTIIWSDVRQMSIGLLLATLIWFSGIGLYDDYLKIACQSTKGLSAKLKIFTMLIGAVLVSIVVFYWLPGDTLERMKLRFLTTEIIDMGLFMILFHVNMIIGSSNAVNLTDGLDGLAVMPAVMIMIAMGLMGANQDLIDQELMVFAAAMAGSGLGFLWYNSYPAEVFMGDTGSLGLGAVLAVFAMLIQQEIAFAIMASLYVIETLSVMIQVVSFRLRRKRVFLMSPIHHHFELKGWSEPKIIVRAWLLTLVLVLMTLMLFFMETAV